MVGKNFSGNTGTVKGFRKKSDYYVTPYSITQQLFDNEKFSTHKTILEPASGAGDMVAVFYRNNFTSVSYDLQKDGKDFLEEKNSYPYIITNPPFSLAFEFINKCKEVATEKFALLLPLSYLHGETRYKYIYQDKKYPLARVYVFTRYPMLGDALREDGKYKTGMMVYAWFVWEKGYRGLPEISWISNQEFILSKKDEEV